MICSAHGKSQGPPRSRPPIARPHMPAIAVAGGGAGAAAGVGVARRAPTKAPTNKWLVAVSVSIGTLMGAIDSSIVNVALTQIQGSLGATVQEITWINTGYAIALVLLMPLTAFLGRRFGQKRLYMTCLGLFL